MTKEKDLTYNERLLKTYNENSNLCVSVKIYEKIKSKLGKHTKYLLKADIPGENDCYIVERIK